jgi:hypothetical protein
MKTLMTTLLLAGTALMAQTGTTPAPAAGSASKSATPSTTAPATVKKHHHKAKAATPATSVPNAAPATK